MRKVGITEDLVRELALQGLATLYHSARRGSEKAAMYLVDRLLGTPDQPFHAAAQKMDEGQVAEQLVRVLVQAGLTPETAAGIVGLLGQSALPEPQPVLDVDGTSEWSDEDDLLLDE